MTTWKLKLTPPGGPITEKSGLTEEQALVVLANLMYGRSEDFVAAGAAAPAEREQALPLAA